MKDLKRILFYRETPGVGDVVMMIRAIELTRLKHPNTEIIVQTRYNELLKYHPAIDYYADLNTIIEDIDIRIDNSFYCAEYEAKHIPVLSISRPQLFCENTAKVLIEHGLEPIEYDGKPQSLYISRELYDWAQSILMNVVSNDTLPIGIFGKSEEIWKTYSHMRDLIKLLLADRRFTLFYFDDKEQLSIWNVNQFIGYSLDKVAALVSQMALVISPDSAGLHIAGGFNIPMIGIFGPTNPLLLIAHYFQVSWIPIKCLHHPCNYNICKRLFCLKQLKPKNIYKLISKKILTIKNEGLVAFDRNFRNGSSPPGFDTQSYSTQAEAVLWCQKQQKEGNRNIVSGSTKKIVSVDVDGIAIVRMKGIGDIIMMMPMLNSLRNTFPNKKITVITSESGAYILQHIDNIDKVISSNYEHTAQNILPPPPPEALQFKQVVNLINAVDFEPIVYQRSRPDNFIKITESQLQCNLNTNQKYLIPDFDIDIDLKKSFVEKYHFSGNVIGCQISSGGQTRTLDIENWIKLADIYDDLVFIWFGDKFINRSLPQNIINTCGKLTIKEFVHGIACCRVFVCPDSSGMHIAPRVNIPVVLLAGSTLVSYHTKYNKHWLVYPLYAMPKLPCSPCFDWQARHDCYKQKGLPWCINRIKPEQIKEKIQEILDG